MTDHSPSLAVCAMLKDEIGCLDEWMRHYTARGVSHFFIIDDGSTDGSLEALKEYERAGVVTLFDSSGMPNVRGKQTSAYNTLALPHIKKAAWLLVLDLDEFLWDTGGLRLPEYFGALSKTTTMVKIRMFDFGDDGHITQPKNLVESFTRRAPLLPLAETRIKCAVRTDSVIKLDFHGCVTSGMCNVDRGRLQLNHYKLQSLERWNNLVVPRGSANRSNDGAYRHTARYFEKMTKIMNRVEDTGLIQQNRLWNL